MAFTIAVIGVIAMDSILIGKEVHRRHGGRGANIAIAAHRSFRNDPTLRIPEDPSHPNGPKKLSPYAGQSTDVNIRVCLNGAVMHWDHGRSMTTALQAQGINTSGVDVNETPNAPLTTGITLNFIDPDPIQRKEVPPKREIRNQFDRLARSKYSSTNFNTPEDLGGGLRPSVIVTNLEMSTEVVEKAIDIAYANGIVSILHAEPIEALHNVQNLDKVTHLIINAYRASTPIFNLQPHEITGFPMACLADRFDEGIHENLVFTLGRNGVYFENRRNGTESTGTFAAYNVEVADPTGAGDAFVGAYAADLVAQRSRGNWNIEWAVQRGAMAAALTLGSIGAQTSMPWANEIAEFWTARAGADGRGLEGRYASLSASGSSVPSVSTDPDSGFAQFPEDNHEWMESLYGYPPNHPLYEGYP